MFSKQKLEHVVYSWNQQDEVVAIWPISGNVRCLDIVKYSTRMSNPEAEI